MTAGPSTRSAEEIRLRVTGLLKGIVTPPDVEIWACEQGVTRVILGDRLSATPDPLTRILEAPPTDSSWAPHLEGIVGDVDAGDRASRHAVQAAQEIRDYLRGSRDSFSVPLAPAPTSPFTMRVHEAIATIPYGQRWTYAELATALGNPGATRAVGTACGKNPLPILVPCHRVVRADGSLGRYTGGDAIKGALLALETGMSSSI